MKLGLFSAHDPVRNKRFFSGVGHELYRALSERIAVIPLVVPHQKPPLPLQLYLSARRRLTRKRYNIHMHPRAVREATRQGMQLAEAAGVEVVLVLGQGRLAFWESDIPATFFSDTLYGAKFDTYSPWDEQRLDPLHLQHLREMGQKAVDNALAIFLTNHYSFDQAAAFGTKIPPEKQIVTFLGPNFEPPPQLTPPLPLPPLRLLWVGSSWTRKGGDDCLAVADALHTAGIALELNVVGKMPPDTSRPYLTFHGYLRKEQPAEFQKLLELYQHSHFLILPSQGDMSPVGLADAAAMGLPAVATMVGGIPDFFPNGGAILLPPDQYRTHAPIAIQEALANGHLFDLRRQARQRYAEALNWPTVADKIVTRLDRTLAST